MSSDCDKLGNKLDNLRKIANTKDSVLKNATKFLEAEFEKVAKKRGCVRDVRFNESIHFRSDDFHKTFGRYHEELKLWGVENNITMCAHGSGYYFSWGRPRIPGDSDSDSE